jgi:14-3-3 protein epsilon
MLILEQVQLGMQIEQIPLQHVNMWVQVHDLPTELMKERIGIQLANYIGSFVEYDKNNNSSFWRQFMRLQVRIDVRLPLKKDTKVKDKEGKWCTVKFKYEKLGIFCFVCGVMGHAENKCEVRFSMEHDDGVRGWLAEIRAENRRQGGRLTSRWLRDDGGGPSEPCDGEGGQQPQQPTGGTRMSPTHADLASDSSHTVHNRPIHNQPTIIVRQDQSLPINAQAHMFIHLQMTTIAIMTKLFPHHSN